MAVSMVPHNCRVNPRSTGPDTDLQDELIERSGPLKAELVAFGKSQRFARDLRSAYTDQFATAEPSDQGEYINFLDRFVLEHETREGQTIVEMFVASRPDLAEAERAMLLGWRDVVEGIFEVERHDDDAAIMANLVDELTYRVRSNKGPQLLKQLAPKVVLWARVVPVGGDWLLSGALTSTPPEGRREMYRTAATFAKTCPAAVFRNPDKVALGWQLHHTARESFIDFFGADVVIVAGHEIADRMDDFWNHHNTRLLATKRQAPADTPGHEQPPPVPSMSIPSELAQAESVGIMFDEVDGLTFLPDYRLLQDAFADPALLAGRRYRETVSGYLKSQTISPGVLRRLAEQDPDRAGKVFARLLGKPRFTWQRDGETLLRRYKARYFNRTPLPCITPLSDR
jgi:hypothetical protein